MICMCRPSGPSRTAHRAPQVRPELPTHSLLICWIVTRQLATRHVRWHMVGLTTSEARMSTLWEALVYRICLQTRRHVFVEWKPWLRPEACVRMRSQERLLGRSPARREVQEAIAGDRSNKRLLLSLPPRTHHTAPSPSLASSVHASLFMSPCLEGDGSKPRLQPWL
jgi:hypothetical protein